MYIYIGCTITLPVLDTSQLKLTIIDTNCPELTKTNVRIPGSKYLDLRQTNEGQL